MATPATSAAHRALLLPEILTNIFEHIISETYYLEEEFDEDAAYEEMCGGSSTFGESLERMRSGSITLCHPFTDSITPNNPCPEPQPLQPTNENVETAHEYNTNRLPQAGYTQNGVLRRCTLVCKTWFHAASPILWSNDTFAYYFSRTGNSPLLSRIQPHRRQYYINFLPRIPLRLASQGNYEEVNAALEGCVFPQERITLYMDFGEVLVPTIAAPDVKIVELDPHYEGDPVTYFVRRREWDGILEQVAVRGLFDLG